MTASISISIKFTTLAAQNYYINQGLKTQSSKNMPEKINNTKV